MKKLSLLFALVFALTTGCSERSVEADAALLGAATTDTTTDTGTTTDTTTDTTTTTNNSTKVVVITDNSQIETGGSETAKITALVKDKNNVLVEGVDVDFSATGGSLRVTSATTGEDGTATAELGVDGDPMNQVIDVTATADGVSSTVSVTASGTGIVLSGPTALVAGDEADVVATLTAGNGQAISNEVITLSSANANAVTPEAAVTDENGQIEFTVGSTAGSDTITASALNGNVTGTFALNVASDMLSFVSPAANTGLAVNQLHTVTARWYSGGAPVVGQDLKFGVTAGQISGASTVTTAANGTAEVQITSSSAGPATITVEGVADGAPATKVTVEYVATVADSMTISAAPRVVDTNGDTVITAKVLDANENPVKGKTVKFEAAQAYGGSMAPSAVTDSNGEAAVTFTAGSLSTAENALAITATVAEDPTITSTVYLTINKRELNITLGTSSLLTKYASNTQYRQAFVVQVADGSGQPVKNATVRMSYSALAYGKGRLTVILNDSGDFDHYARVDSSGLSMGCVAEDADKDGVLDAGEDVNGNGVLDPQNPATLVASESETPTLSGKTITTDENGFGYFDMVYPRSNANWSTIELQAIATANGAEAVDTFEQYLMVLADDVSDEGANPPNYFSPYGTVLDCTDPD